MYAIVLRYTQQIPPYRRRAPETHATGTIRVPFMTPSPPSKLAMSFTEFVLLASMATVIGALSTYIVLPALSQISLDMGLEDISLSQAIISFYLMGFGASQLIFGPLSDSLGRKYVLLAGLSIFILASVLSSVSNDFSILLAARFLQGIGAGAGRVISMSMIRDRYFGSELGRALSCVTLAFSLFPVLAPLMGQAILLTAGWRWIFSLLVIVGLIVSVWAAVRLDETLNPEHRRPFSIQTFTAAQKKIFSTRLTATCIVVLGLTLANNYAFIGLSHQIIDELFDARDLFASLFGFIAAMLALAALINTWLLKHWGIRTVVQSTLVAALVLNSIYLICALLHWISLPVFIALQAASMFLFGLTMPNLYALALEPVADVAGTASAVIGFLITILGATLGFLIGQLFSDSLLPIATAYFLLSALALCSVLLAQRRRKTH